MEQLLTTRLVESLKPESADRKTTLQDYEPLLVRYRQSCAVRSIWQLTSTLILFAISWTLTYWSLSVSYFLTLALVVPTALLLVRIFIIQHDCGHRSFFASKRANDWVGSMLGVITLTPYHCWRREHASHHATSGDLDRRGRSGEIWTMTVDEYRRASFKERIFYRVYRNPLILFGIGSAFHFIVRQRLTTHLPPTWKAERRSVHWTNFWLAVVAICMCWLVGTWNFILIQLLVMTLAAQVGVWLFYVQHQYEDAFWESGAEWDYVEAAMSGSSHYRLPKVLQWFTANIGLHHIHHLDSRIPNYRLQDCHDNHPQFQSVTEISLCNSIPCAFLKLWDEKRGKMVGFKSAAQPPVVSPIGVKPTDPVRR